MSDVFLVHRLNDEGIQELRVYATYEGADAYIQEDERRNGNSDGIFLWEKSPGFWFGNQAGSPIWYVSKMKLGG
jgi:hypothetical protein